MEGENALDFYNNERERLAQLIREQKTLLEDLYQQVKTIDECTLIKEITLKRLADFNEKFETLKDMIKSYKNKE